MADDGPASDIMVISTRLCTQVIAFIEVQLTLRLPLAIQIMKYSPLGAGAVMHTNFISTRPPIMPAICQPDFT